MTEENRPISAPKRVAVVRLSAAGDVVLTTPALESLKAAWPETEIIYVTKALYHPLIKHHPAVSQVVPWGPEDSVGVVRSRLLELGVDALLDLHSSQRSRLLRWSLPGKPAVVWNKRPWLTNLTVRSGIRPYRPAITIAQRYHRAVEALVGRELPPGRLRFYGGPAESEEAARVLREAGLDPERPLIGVSPGAKWNTKRWPAERFGEVIGRAQAAGFQCVITGSPDETDLAEAIQAVAPEAVNLIGKVPFSLLGGIIERCTAFLANDSAPMHISRGLGVPTLAFFGSTAPEQFHFEGHALLFSNEPCAPCHFYGRKACPKKHFNCLMNISADQAWLALQPLLDGERRGYLRG
ncbi:MAG: glycosyltransferase family 9 protein [Myxococcota bacterium]|nr:glycosyltransferase family 9 protein [Myxococcota bacterium]